MKSSHCRSGLFRVWARHFLQFNVSAFRWSAFFSQAKVGDFYQMAKWHVPHRTGNAMSPSVALSFLQRFAEIAPGFVIDSCLNSIFVAVHNWQ